MKELPNRSNPIYKEIEQFKDYELTDCIAYEMAIRNEEIINKINLFNTTFPNNLESLAEDLKVNFYLSKDIIYEIPKFEEYIESKITLESIEDGAEKLLKYLQSNNLLRYIPQFRKHVSKDLNNLTIEELLEYKNFFFFYGEKDNIKYNCGIFNDLDLSIVPKEFLLIQKDNIKKNGKIDSNFFSRPKLHIPKDIDKTIDLKINPNLPKDELIAYISKIKDEYDEDNSIIKNSLELLGEELDKSEKMKSKALPKDKEKRKKTMADAFYIYDTWKILEIHYAEKTKELKEKLEKEIQSIKNNLNYDKYDRKSKIDDAKRNNEFNLSNYTKVSLKTEIASQLNISIDTVDKLHTLMIKYIDNLKYKELITGLSN
jgi:hypothetical protein